MCLEEMLEKLQESGASCIIYKNNNLIYQSKAIGVKPLLGYLMNNEKESILEELTLVDKVVGKAALLLAKMIGINRIYTKTSSKVALNAAEIHGIIIETEEVVSEIANRDNTGMCPLEESVLDIDDPTDAYRMIQSTISRLMSTNT